jgi:predicted alpha/beta-fold hydrolase
MNVSNKLILIVILALFSTSTQADCVILLHGLARTSNSMDKLEKHLTEQKYHVVNLGYASREGTIESLATRAINAGLEQCDAKQKISFVTHSLGGILVRQYLSQ